MFRAAVALFKHWDIAGEQAAILTGLPLRTYRGWKAGEQGRISRDGRECAAPFYPDLTSNPTQGRRLDYNWNGERADDYREPGSGRVFRIV
jgi:hypothetical protein